MAWTFLFGAFEARCASMTATLDRDSVAAGESATLTLTFEGGEPENVPAINSGPNLSVANRGSSRNVSIVNGQMTSTLTQTYAVTPLQPGAYQIPALMARVGGQTVASQPLRLTAVKGEDAQSQTGEQQLAFMKLFLPQKQVYIGQPLSVELQVFVRDGVLNAEEILRAFDTYDATPVTAEGCRVLRTAHANRRRAQNGAAAYTVSTLVTAVTPAKTGKASLASIKVPLRVQLPVPGQRRRDMFDPFGMFQQTQQREVVLQAEPEVIEVLPLPTAGAPPGFNGAVGSFKMTVEAGPTNVAVGDPVTVRTRIEGRGNLDGLALASAPDGWGDFRVYPAEGKVETSDPLGLQGAKNFEQVVVPQSEKVTALPSLTFSYFDPETKTYQTLSSRPIPLTVRPGGTLPAPTVALSRADASESAPPARDIVPIKRKLEPAPWHGMALVRSPGFLALQLVPVAVFLSAAFWRRRRDAFESNPRLRRRREVGRKVQKGLEDLRKHASANNSDDFFLAVFRLLQEQIGERLDAPASSITEAVIDERLCPVGAPEELLARTRELFQMCDQARYAPVRSSAQLEALVPRVEKALTDLKGLQI
jgi:hypothetical protein